MSVSRSSFALRVAVGLALGLPGLPALPLGCFPDPLVDGGPVTFRFDVPSVEVLDPFLDPRALGGTLALRIMDLADPTRTAAASFPLDAGEPGKMEEIPYGEAMDVVAEVRGPDGTVLGHGEVRSTRVGADDVVSIPMRKRLVYAADRGWPQSSLGDDDAALHVIDLSGTTEVERDGEAVHLATRLDALRDVQRPDDAYLTRDGRVLVVAGLALDADPGAAAVEGRVFLFDTGSHEQEEPALVVPEPLGELVPLGDGRRALGLPAEESNVVYLVDLDDPEGAAVTPVPLAVPGAPAGIGVTLSGGDATPAGDVVFLAARVRAPGASVLSGVLRVDIPSAAAGGTPRFSFSAAAAFDDARDVRVVDDRVYLLGATARDGGFADSFIEVRGLDLAEERAPFALPRDDTNAVDLLVHPGGAGLIVGLDRLFDGGGPRNGCCAGALVVDLEGSVTFGPTDVSFAAEVAARAPDGTGVAGMTHLGNNQGGELAFTGQDLEQLGPYLDIDAPFYLDHVAGIAIPFGERL